MPGDGWTPENLTVDWIYDHQGSTQDGCLSSDYVFGKEGLLGSNWSSHFYPESRGRWWHDVNNRRPIDEFGCGARAWFFPLVCS